jgi:hypothetical protein
VPPGSSGERLQAAASSAAIAIATRAGRADAVEGKERMSPYKFITSALRRIAGIAV